MLSTVVALLAAVALLVPGFLVAELANARGARSSRSDLELALRALFYALVIHLLFLWWSVRVFDDVGHGRQLASPRRCTRVLCRRRAGIDAACWRHLAQRGTGARRTPGRANALVGCCVGCRPSPRRV